MYRIPPPPKWKINTSTKRTMEFGEMRYFNPTYHVSWWPDDRNYIEIKSPVKDVCIENKYIGQLIEILTLAQQELESK